MFIPFLRSLNQKLFKTTPQITHSFALIDNATGVTLAHSQRSAPVLFLQGNLRDTRYTYINPTASSTINSTPPEQYPELTWNRKTKRFTQTHPDVLTEELRALSRLARAKLETIGRMIYDLNIARNELRIGIIFQETVYMTKKLQAHEFMKSGYDESRIMEYPYILHEADMKKTSFREAADAILFKAKLADDILLRTEQLRLEYFNKVKEADDPEMLKTIFKDFHKACYVNARV